MNLLSALKWKTCLRSSRVREARHWVFTPPHLLSPSRPQTCPPQLCFSIVHFTYYRMSSAVNIASCQDPLKRALEPPGIKSHSCYLGRQRSLCHCLFHHRVLAIAAAAHPAESGQKRLRRRSLLLGPFATLLGENTEECLSGDSPNEWRCLEQSHSPSSSGPLCSHSGWPGWK